MPFIFILAVLSTLSLILCYFNKLRAFGLSGGYVNWFCSYLTNRQSQVHVFGILLSPFVALSLCCPSGMFLGLCFSTYSLMTCNLINYSRYLLLADDIKIFRAINSPNDCNLLQSDIDSVQGWSTANFMKFNISKTRVISFSVKTNILI
jgi:hypothetical protein